MATVATDDANRLSATVDKRRKAVLGSIAQVENAYKLALEELDDSGLFDYQTEAEANGAKTIRSLRSGIDGWIARGKAVLDSGRQYVEVYPKTNGWAGWTRAGEEYIKGINNVVDTGENHTLQSIVETVKEAPATSAKAVQKAATEALNATGQAVSLGVLRPIGYALGAYVLFRLVVR